MSYDIKNNHMKQVKIEIEKGLAIDLEVHNASSNSIGVEISGSMIVVKDSGGVTACASGVKVMAK